MKLLILFCGLLLLTAGGMLVLSHHDTTARADSAFRKFAPITATFSRFRGDKEHLLSVYWRLHVAGKKQLPRTEVAYWSLRPFRHVTIVTK
ncbi:MAG: hypothetical protein ABI540_03240 [Spartobacteria bacterium]